MDARTELVQVPRSSVARLLIRFLETGSARDDHVSWNRNSRGSGNPGLSGGIGLVEFGFTWHEGAGAGQPVSLRINGFRLRNGAKPMRASAVVNPGLPQVRISAESKALELRGIVTSWSSEQEHAMSGTAGGFRHREVYGSVEG